MSRPTKWLVSPAFPQGKAVELTDEEIAQVAADLAVEPPPLSLNEQLENAFMEIIPTHIGTNYLTQQVISDILMAKVAIKDANTVDPSGMFGKAVLTTLQLPSELEADRQTLLGLFP